jgi:hypothetical protein
MDHLNPDKREGEHGDVIFLTESLGGVGDLLSRLEGQFR